MVVKTALVKQVQGITLAGNTDSNHWVMMDGPTEFGGANAGTRPKELLLLALGGCTASDVISILQKKRVELDGFEIHITAKQRDEHPQVFSEIHLEYVIRGNHVRQEDVVRAIELSESKYCSVSAMLRPAVPITWTYRIEPSRAARPAA
jgi:putative redox protein